MKQPLTRRSFLKRTALTAGTLSTVRFLPGTSLFGADAPSRKLNIVQIGCGVRGMQHLEYVVPRSKENLIAIVDPDEKSHIRIKKWFESKEQDPSKLKVFTDYRVMYDQLGKELDAVFIAAPNHHHASAASPALHLSKGVYCEKPLCHDVAENRKLRALAAASKAPAQMGNQGHCEEGYIRLCEFIAAGVVGPITETHSWTDRANGGAGPRPPVLPVPEGMHWEEWLGPAPFREFHSDLHPHEWHGWYDFGNGSIGNMGCHVLDGLFWALKVQHPTAITAEEIRDGSAERYPTGSRIRWDIPARGKLPAFKAYWYEGLKKGADSASADVGKNKNVKGGARNQPPLLAQLRKQYPDEEFDSSGTLYVGKEGVLYTGTYGNKMRILPRERMADFEKIPHTLPRLPKGGTIMSDFLEAVRAGRKETAASFEYGARLTEFSILGNLAQHAGVGQTVQWDGPGMKVTNLPELNQWLSRPCRQGWTNG